MSNFDHIASYYDFLARFVFGKNIVEAQEYFLSEIKEGDRILILGGGTGWILESIFKNAMPDEIWYVYSSSKMIEKSKSKIFTKSKVHFFHGTVEAILVDLKFDVVITNFFLDIFSEAQLPILIRNTKFKLNADGIWLCTDFVDTDKWMHKILIRSMYSFFRILAKLKNKNLPDWEGNLVKEGFVPHKEKSFWNGLIKSMVFKQAF